MTDPDRIGRFEVLGRIGAGGMGIVYAARDAELDRKVAIKLLRRSPFAEDDEGAARLRREAQALARVSHPHVVHVYEVGEHEGQVYLAMEFVDGRTLRKWQLGDHAWREVVKMYVAAGRGLVAAHAAEIVHRDFKPDNVIVGSDDRPRVLDFGLARPGGESRLRPDPDADLEALDLTDAGTVLGTPAYMPPEQLDGMDADARSDQFAFCVSLFEALYGQRPFSGRSITALGEAIRSGLPAEVDPTIRRVPPAVHAAILVGLRPDPGARHPNMRRLLDTLDRAASSRRLSVRRIVFALIALAGLVALAFVIYGSLQPDDGPADAAPERDAHTDVLATSDLPPLLTTPLPDDPLGVTVHRLDNGLTVYIVPRRDQPMVRVAVAVRLGAADEPPETPGLHHITAHMLDAGSQRLGSRDPTQEAALLQERDAKLAELAAATGPQARLPLLHAVERLEAEATALTIADERTELLLEAGAQDLRFRSRSGLALSLSVPAPSLPLVLAVEADRIRDPSFRGYLAQTDTVLAEARLALDGTDADLQKVRELLAPAVGPHPTPTREAEYLAHLPFAAIKRTFGERFVPNNLAIVLVGDVDTAAALAAAREAFGDRTPAEVPSTSPTAAADPRRVFATAVGVGEPRATVAFTLPAAIRDDRTALQFLAEILEDAVGDPDGPLPSVGTLDATVETEAFIVTATAAPQAELDDIEAELDGLLKDAVGGKLDDALLAKVTARRELRLTRMSADPAAIADVVARSYIERRSWEEALAELSRPVSGPALAMTARALQDAFRAVAHRTPGAYEAPTIPELPVEIPRPTDEGRSAFAEALLARPRSRIEPQFLLPGRHFERENGLVTTQTESSLVVATIRYPIGVAHDWWVCDALRAWLAEPRRSLARSAVALEVDCGRNTTAIRLEGADDRFDPAWDAVLARYEAPTLSALDIRHHADSVLARRQRRRTDPDRTFVSLTRLITWERGGGLEHGLPNDGALAHADPNTMTASLRGALSLTPTVTYAGPNPATLKERLPGPLGPADPAAAGEAPHVGAAPEPRPFRARRPAATSVFLVSAKHAATARLAVAIAAPTGARATVLAQALATRATRRFHDGATWGRLHGVDHQHLGKGDSAIVATAEVPRTRVPEAAAMLTRVLTEPLTEAEFNAALRAVEESTRAHRPSRHAIPQLVARWPGTTDPRMTLWEDLSRLKFPLKQSAVPTIAVVADERAIDLPGLERLGKLVRVDADELVL